MTTLDTMLTQWVTPALRARGWRKKGRVYHFGSPTGDLAAVAIQKAGESRPNTISFFVEIGPITAAAAQWVRDTSPKSRRHTVPGTLWWDRISAPEPVEHPGPDGGPPRFGTHTWMIDLTDPGSKDRCGQILAHTLVSWAPTAESWTDRKALAAFLTEHNDYGTRNWRNTGLVLVDDGPSPELDDIIAFARSKDDTVFADWLTTRSSAQPTQEDAVTRPPD